MPLTQQLNCLSALFPSPEVVPSVDHKLMSAKQFSGVLKHPRIGLMDFEAHSGNQFCKTLHRANYHFVNWE